MFPSFFLLSSSELSTTLAFLRWFSSVSSLSDSFVFLPLRPLFFLVLVSIYSLYSSFPLSVVHSQSVKLCLKGFHYRCTGHSTSMNFPRNSSSDDYIRMLFPPLLATYRMSSLTVRPIGLFRLLCVHSFMLPVSIFSFYILFCLSQLTYRNLSSLSIAMSKADAMGRSRCKSLGRKELLLSGFLSLRV